MQLSGGTLNAVDKLNGELQRTVCYYYIIKNLQHTE